MDLQTCDNLGRLHHRVNADIDLHEDSIEELLEDDEQAPEAPEFESATWKEVTSKLGIGMKAVREYYNQSEDLIYEEETDPKAKVTAQTDPKGKGTVETDPKGRVTVETDPKAKGTAETESDGTRKEEEDEESESDGSNEPAPDSDGNLKRKRDERQTEGSDEPAAKAAKTC